MKKYLFPIILASFLAFFLFSNCISTNTHVTSIIPQPDTLQSQLENARMYDSVLNFFYRYHRRWLYEKKESVVFVVVDSTIWRRDMNSNAVLNNVTRPIFVDKVFKGYRLEIDSSWIPFLKQMDTTYQVKEKISDITFKTTFLISKDSLNTKLARSGGGTHVNYIKSFYNEWNSGVFKFSPIFKKDGKAILECEVVGEQGFIFLFEKKEGEATHSIVKVIGTWIV